MKIISKACAAVLVLSGLVGLAARLTGIRAGAELGGPAFGFVVAGIALWLGNVSHRAARRLARWIGLAVCPAVLLSPVPTLLVAIFLLCALGLFLLDSRTRRDRRPGEWFTVPALFASFVILLNGFLLPAGAAAFLAWQPALLLLILSVGIIFSRPAGGVMAAFATQRLGSITARRLLPVAVVFPLVLAWMRMEGERAGLYGREFGTALFAVAFMAVLAVAVWRHACWLDRYEDERRRQEQVRSELAAIVECSDEAIIGASPDGIIRSWNPGAQRMYGYTAEEIVGKPASVLVPDTRKEEVPELLERIARGGRVDQYRTVWQRKDGSTIPVSLSISPVTDEGGRVTGIAVVTRDFTIQKAAEDALRRSQRDLGDRVAERTAELARTNDELRAEIAERRRAEEALRSSESKLAEAQRIAGLGNWEHDLSTGTLLWSDAVYRIFGLDPAREPLSLKEFLQRVHPAEREQIQDRMQQALDGISPYSVEHRILLPDGSVRYVHERAEIVRDETGRPLRVVGTVQDITERRKLEEQFFQAQKMEAVGRLAGGIAHDFNNLLSIIIGYSDLLEELLPDGTPPRRHIGQVKQAAQRAANLTRQLLAFSRKQVLEPKVLDLNAAISSLARMLPRLIGEDIEMRTNLAPGLWNVRADPGQLEQVLLNLVVNARDAMPDGGVLTISTANAELDDTYAQAHAPVTPGPYVMVAVADTGIGMDAATQARVFEPFFTTKPTGKGTGLGLSTVYGIVKQSGGYIWVYSEPGRGTTFKVYLPRGGAMPQPLQEAAPVVVARGTETVLLVEDEEPLREVIKHTLQKNGYTVLEARNGNEALELCRQHSSPIHLVITDVVMPGMSGGQLGRQLARMCSGAKVLYMSGYTDDAIVHHGVLDSGLNFIEKPFRAVDLVRRIRELLDTPVTGEELTHV